MPARLIRLLDSPPESRVLRCVLGAIAAGLAALLSAALTPVLEDEAPFEIALGFVALATWIAGMEGGVCCLLLSAALVNYVIVHPHFQFAVRGHAQGLLVFLAVGCALVWLVGRWRRAEQAVRVSEAKAREAGQELHRQFHELEAIYRTAPTGLCVLDRQMRWVRLNERLAEMNGFPVEAHIGKTPRELIPDVGEQAEAALREIIETGRPLPDFEMSGTTPAEPGVTRWWKERWSPIKDDAGAVVGVAVATEDITEQKRAEHALRAALEAARRGEAEIASIYDSAPIGLCIFDRQGRYLRINKRLAEINGVSPEDHVGRTFREVVPDIAEQSEVLLRRVIDTGQPMMDVEIHGELPSRPGVVRTWAENWFPVRDQTGEVVEINVAVEEITERKRVEAELRQANQVKDDFLATLSHELRTPLNAIMGWAQMLARGGLDQRLTHQAVETIFRNAQAQNQLVTDVLDVSGLMAGKLRLEIQEVDAIPLLRHAIDSIQPAADAKRLALHIFSEFEPAAVSADPGRLQQVFWNLLSNAVKFTEPGGRVIVRLTRRDSSLEIAVTDTGIGIRPDFLPRVFDRFSQADTSASRQHSGLGLGLSIVRHIVELHGGTVYATSDGEGRGSTFTISLPVRAVRHEAAPGNNERGAAPSPTPRPAPALKGLHVLVVDDVADASQLVAAELEREGLRVTVAASAEEGLGQLMSARPDVLIADIGMPGIDGYEFIRRVRGLPAEAGGLTPAIALTAYGRPVDRARAAASGFFAHLTKPVLRDDLLAAIAAHKEGKTGETVRTPTTSAPLNPEP